MQMNLFSVEAENAVDSPARKMVHQRVLRDQVMLIDRPTPTKPTRCEPVDSMEEEVERWDGLY